MKGKEPYPTLVEGTKTLMVDHKAPGVTAPVEMGKKTNVENKGVAFAKQEWLKNVIFFSYEEKGHLID